MIYYVAIQKPLWRKIQRTTESFEIHGKFDRKTALYYRNKFSS